MGRVWVAACALALGAAPAARAQGAVRRTDVPREYGLDLVSASPMMHYASDVTFDGDSIHARGGIAPLPGSEAVFQAADTTSQTAAPLAAGSGYLVNDRAGHTWVLHVATVDGNRVSVTVAPSATTLRWQAPAPRAPPPAAPAAASPAAPPPSAAAPAPAPPPPLRGRHIELNVYRMEGSSVTKYAFHQDGTFRREWIFRSYLGSNTSEDRGAYAIQGSTLILQIGATANASLGGAGSNGYQNASRSSAVKEERHRVSLRGSSGIVIDGKLFERMTGSW